jgi:hypothetical protein
MKNLTLFFFERGQTMSRRSNSSGVISIFTMLIWAGIAYMWFGGDDDSDKKAEVEIREPSVTVEQTISKKDTEIDIRGVKKELTEALTKAKEELLKTKDKIMEEVNKKKDSEKPVERPDEKEGPIMTAEPETPKEELKPVTNKPIEMEMKKL